MNNENLLTIMVGIVLIVFASLMYRCDDRKGERAHELIMKDKEIRIMTMQTNNLK